MIAENRYNTMTYKKCGNSGLMIPQLAFGIWNGFGECCSYESGRELLLTAFNCGITHIDTANNYGPPPGTAEEFVGKIIHNELRGYRDELLIATKAGYEMWNGPYGDGGSRKYLISSLDQSLKRMKLDYVDIFYHHRRDVNTPMEETMGALADLVRQGKALYVGISNYNAEDTQKASEILAGMGVKLLIHQFRYNLLSREPEDGLFQVLNKEKIGSVAFCPLEQGLLTMKYAQGIPKDSRANNKNSYYLHETDIKPDLQRKVFALNEFAKERGQTLPQMALAWDIREGGVTSVILGASRKEQILENVELLQNNNFTNDELKKIDEILAQEA